MKAIHQLISHFHHQKRLTKAHLDQFLKKGYWGIRNERELRTLEQQIGETFYFETTGESNGPLWGIDIYTSDSSLGKACVHAGILKIGQTAVVKVTIVAPLPMFPGSTRNGVVSNVWTTGWPGAYTVHSAE